MAERSNWDAAVEAFLREKRRANLSPGTLETYRFHLVGPRVRAFLDDAKISSVDQFTATALRNFELELTDAGCRPSTVATYHGTLKNFLGFCRQEGLAIESGVLGVSGPRVPVESPGTISVEEERRLLQAARTTRDAFLIKFLLRSGLRRQEAATITVDDIKEGPDGHFLLVRQGKGRKDRIIPLDTRTEKFSRELTRYVREVRPRDTAERTLFLTSRKEHGDYRALGSEGIKTLFRRLEATTGIKCNPHRFRHTFASRAIQRGVTPMAVQRALGHTTLHMVNRYVHFDPASLIKAWD